MNKKLIIISSAAATAIILSGGIAASKTLAADPGFRHDTLVEKIATKFNLNKTEVQTVFDENRQEKQAEMQKKNDDMLSQAVTNGKITQVQMDLITAKHVEVKQKMDEIRNITDAKAKKTALDQLQSDLDKWTSDNGLDTQWVQFMNGRGGEGRMGGQEKGQGRMNGKGQGRGTGIGNGMMNSI